MLGLWMAGALLAAPAPYAGQGSACAILDKDERMCTCTDFADHKFVMDCEIPIRLPYLNLTDSIGMKVMGDPCADPATISIDVTERNFAIDMPVQTITVGSALLVPIPGLSFNVPDLGQVSIDVDVQFDGTIDKLRLQAGINACLKAHGETLCGEQIAWLRNLLPLWIIDGTWNFGTLCSVATI